MPTFNHYFGIYVRVRIILLSRNISLYIMFPSKTVHYYKQNKFLKLLQCLKRPLCSTNGLDYNTSVLKAKLFDIFAQRTFLLQRIIKEKEQ